jgi:hypothetical protein
LSNGTIVLIAKGVQSVADTAVNTLWYWAAAIMTYKAASASSSGSDKVLRDSIWRDAIFKSSQPEEIRAKRRFPVDGEFPHKLFCT